MMGISMLSAQNLSDDERWKQVINVQHRQVDSLLQEKAFKQSLALAKSCLLIVPKSEGPCTYLGLCYDRIALVLYRKGEPDSALAYYQKALKAYEHSRVPNYHEIGTVLNNLGAVYGRKGEDSIAVCFHRKSLKIKSLHAPDNYKSIRQSLNNIGHTYLKMAVPDSALWYYKLALKINPEFTAEEKARLTHDIASSFYLMSERDSCGKYIQIGLSAFHGLKNLSRKGLVKFYSLKAIEQELKGAYRLAAAYYEKKIKAQSQAGTSRLGRAISYERHANCLLELARYDAAKVAIDNALSLVNHQIPEVHPFYGQLYNQLGLYYERIGDLSKSEASYLKSIRIKIHAYGDSDPQIAVVFHNLGKQYYYDGEYDRAIRYFEKAISMYLNTGKGNHAAVATIYESIGQVYIELKNFEQAKHYIEKALAINQQLYRGNNLSSAANQYSLGIIAFNQNQNTAALTYLQDALTQKQEVYTTKHPDIAITLLAIANVYWQDGAIGTADSYFQRAIADFGFEMHHDYKSVTDKEGLLKALSQYGRFCTERYLQTQSGAWLEQANSHLSEAVVLGEKISRIMDANLQLSRLIHRMYENAIRVAYINFRKDRGSQRLETLINLMDQSRAQELRRSLQNSQALKVAGIPEVLLEEEHRLRKRLINFKKQKQLSLYEGDELSQQYITALSDSIGQTEERYDYLINVFESQFPKYFQAKYNDKPISLTKLQNGLSADQAILQFFTGERFLYSVLIRDDTILVRECPRNFPLNELVHAVREGITSYHAENRPLSMLSDFTERYIAAACKLHTALIAPLQSFLPERLTIIPDDVLGYLPFGVLLKERPNRMTAFHEYPYFVRNHSLSYCYSIALLSEMEAIPAYPPNIKPCLTVAPFCPKSFSYQISAKSLPVLKLRRDSLGTLPFSGREVSVVKQITQGQSLYGSEATVNHFIHHASDYRIMHLATHAFADNNRRAYAYLAFAGIKEEVNHEKFYIRDIYNLSLNADMVVLSACQTGTGMLQKGEGVISIARAFAYAGAKSIVTSLWKIDDQSTAVIMEHYYSFLAKGFPKDIALRKAKLLFIDENRGMKAHPFFWSAFIPIGDMHPFIQP